MLISYFPYKPSYKINYGFMGLPSIILVKICENRNSWFLTQSSMAKRRTPQTASHPYSGVKKYPCHLPVPRTLISDLHPLPQFLAPYPPIILCGETVPEQFSFLSFFSVFFNNTFSLGIGYIHKCLCLSLISVTTNKFTTFVLFLTIIPSDSLFQTEERIKPSFISLSALRT